MNLDIPYWKIFSKSPIYIKYQEDRFAYDSFNSDIEMWIGIKNIIYGELFLVEE